MQKICGEHISIVMGEKMYFVCLIMINSSQPKALQSQKKTTQI